MKMHEVEAGFKAAKEAVPGVLLSPLPNTISGNFEEMYVSFPWGEVTVLKLSTVFHRLGLNGFPQPHEWFIKEVWQDDGWQDDPDDALRMTFHVSLVAPEE